MDMHSDVGSFVLPETMDYLHIHLVVTFENTSYFGTSS